MRFMKCYLAKNTKGQIVTAQAAVSPEDGSIWTCTSCGCLLIHHAGIPGEPAWFDHDQQTVTVSVLMSCAHLDPEVKAEARHRKLRNMINGLDVTVMTLSWYCVWCSDHYQGVKLCPRCQTGIYSIEEANWQINYCCSTR